MKCRTTPASSHALLFDCVRWELRRFQRAFAVAVAFILDLRMKATLAPKSLTVESGSSGVKLRHFVSGSSNIFFSRFSIIYLFDETNCAKRRAGAFCDWPCLHDYFGVGALSPWRVNMKLKLWGFSLHFSQRNRTPLVMAARLFHAEVRYR